jgi:serine protease Do
VKVQTITPVLATGLNLSRKTGVIISDVFPDGQGYKSGLQIGDIILSLNGKVMENGRQFEVNLYQRRVNVVVELEIMRGSKKEKFWIPVKERDDDENRFLEMVEPDQNLVPELGILAINLEKNVRSLMPPLRREGGVLVAARSVERPYWGFGLNPGDIIYSVNKKLVEDIGSLRQLLSEYNEGDAIVLEVERRRELMYVAYEME